MKKSGNGIKITLAVTGLFFGTIALIIAFLPLRMFAFVPGAVALIFGLASWLIGRNKNLGVGLPRVTVIVPIIAMLIAGFSQVIFRNKIEKDTEFIQKIEETSVDVQNDLDEALDEALNSDSLTTDIDPE